MDCSCLICTDPWLTAKCIALSVTGLLKVLHLLLQKAVSRGVHQLLLCLLMHKVRSLVAQVWLGVLDCLLHYLCHLLSCLLDTFRGKHLCHDIFPEGVLVRSAQHQPLIRLQQWDVRLPQKLIWLITPGTCLKFCLMPSAAKCLALMTSEKVCLKGLHCFSRPRWASQARSLPANPPQH